MTFNVIKTPREWDRRIRLSWDNRFKDSLGPFIVDDLTQVFSNETYGDRTNFFRDIHSLQVVANVAFSEDRPVTIGSIPSSLGCEGYSLAMLLNHWSDQTTPEYKIYMADISEAKLNSAATGVFPKTMKRDIPEVFHRFTHRQSKKKDVFRINSSVRDKVEILPPLDVMNPAYDMPKMDIILCLNLLYYMPDNAARLAVIDYLASKSKEALVFSFGSDGIENSLYDDAFTHLYDAGFVQVEDEMVPLPLSTYMFVPEGG